MNKIDQKKIEKMLENSVKSYKIFAERDDIDKTCIRKELLSRQNGAFVLAEALYQNGFISWEQCCQHWLRVDIGIDDNDISCSFQCDANENGICKLMKEKQERLLQICQTNN